MQSESASVADDLQSKATTHAYHETPGTVYQTKGELSKNDDREDDEVDQIGNEGWLILDLGIGQRACG